MKHNNMENVFALSKNGDNNSVWEIIICIGKHKRLEVDALCNMLGRKPTYDSDEVSECGQNVNLLVYTILNDPQAWGLPYL